MFVPNIHEPQSNPEIFEPLFENKIAVEKPFSKTLITLEQINAGSCLLYFGKWIDAGETAMPHFILLRELIWPLQQKISSMKILLLIVHARV